MDDSTSGPTRVQILSYQNTLQSKTSLVEIPTDIGTFLVIKTDNITSENANEIFLNLESTQEFNINYLQSWLKPIFDSFSINVYIAQNFLDLINKYGFENVWKGGDSLKALMDDVTDFMDFEQVIQNLFSNNLDGVDEMNSDQFHIIAHDFVNFANIVFDVTNRISGRNPNGYFEEIIDQISLYKIYATYTGITDTTASALHRSVQQIPHAVFVRSTLELILALDMFIKDPEVFLNKGKREEIQSLTKLQSPQES